MLPKYLPVVPQCGHTISGAVLIDSAAFILDSGVIICRDRAIRIFSFVSSVIFCNFALVL